MTAARTITVPLDEVAAAISDSLRAVLRAHGYQVHTTCTPTYTAQLDPMSLDALLLEAGRNSAQALVGLAVVSEEES